MVYQGSKSRYSKYIVPILQKQIDKNNITTFIDACCGGCNIIDKIVCANRIAIDKNPYLIELLKYGQANGDQAAFPGKVTKEEWDRVKKFPDECPWLTGMYAFFCSYSARGFAGGFGVNPGHESRYYSRKSKFLKQMPRLKDVVFECGDIFAYNFGKVNNALIYFDPPYQSCKTYDKVKFSHEDFWDLVRKLSYNNIVFVSEQEAPSDFESVWSLDVVRRTFGKGGAKQVKE